MLCFVLFSIILLIQCKTNPCTGACTHSSILHTVHFCVWVDFCLQVRSRFTLTEKSEQYGLHNCLDNIQSLALQSEHVKLWLEVHSEMCLVVFSNETSDDLRGDPSWMLQNLKVSQGLITLTYTMLHIIRIAELSWSICICLFYVARI